MDVDSVTYAERLMPDFEVFDIIAREISKKYPLGYGDFACFQSIGELFYMMLAFNKKLSDAEKGKVTLSRWNRIALRSTRELNIDRTLQTDWDFSFIEIPNPSDDTPDYFYYIIISDTDYVERKPSKATVHLKYDAGDEEITEIVGVIV